MSETSCNPLAIARTALALAPTQFVAKVQVRMAKNGVAAAVRAHDTGALYKWIVSLARLQGVSDRAADGFAAGRASVDWTSVTAALARTPPCRRLQSHWNNEGCGYRKGVPDMCRTDAAADVPPSYARPEKRRLECWCIWLGVVCT